ncbi:hypothetical protein WG78_07780 [Amantichitinum ursilacus]|uniref:Uncharacterized protein n=1 Tax=Amantichitinum ursilacus TaxID=857265 RepID=A0A0N1JT35_9NEIS|nr:hypothetical protein WG78_07780 [Amantichitinum ursilacus]
MRTYDKLIATICNGQKNASLRASSGRPMGDVVVATPARASQGYF